MIRCSCQKLPETAGAGQSQLPTMPQKLSSHGCASPSPAIWILKNSYKTADVSSSGDKNQMYKKIYKFTNILQNYLTSRQEKVCIDDNN